MRLRRSGRNKGTSANKIADAAPAVAVTLDEPKAIQPPSTGNVLGLSASLAEERTEPTNEWGFYDPDLAGIGALLSTIDTSAISFPENLEEDPRELLIRQKSNAPAEPAEAFAFASTSDSKEAVQPPSAVAAVASCRVGHLAPLSLWARVAEVDAAPQPDGTADRVSYLLAQRASKVGVHRDSQFASSGLAAEIGRLTHPALVAMTGLSPVCRIRGIRTQPANVITEPVDELPGWPQPSVVPLPDTVTVEALEELSVEAATAEAIQPEAPPDALALETLETPFAELIADGEAVELHSPVDLSLPPDGEPLSPAGTDPAVLSDEPAAFSPTAEVDASQEVGLVAVAPPTLDVLAIEFTTVTGPDDLFPADREPISEAAPAVELPPVEVLSEPPVFPQAAGETLVGESTPPPSAIHTQVLAQDLPAQIVPPLRRRRRTALALG